ncbi:glycerate kinase [Dehalococcoidia bacterium]|nr:glycerate kinase [Dehalococcoidia bacterium]
MRIVIAPQAFKGSIRGIDVAKAMDEGVHRVYPGATTILIPIADGGDGTLDSLLQGDRCELFQTTVTGPLGSSITKASWGVMGDSKTAVIELAQASGLALLSKSSRNPRLATTYGTGELIQAALDKGYQRIIVGLGGSATNDGGSGIAQALGAKFTYANGATNLQGGAALGKLEHIDARYMDSRLTTCHIRAAADVINPLCGSEGASAVYGPQKGATAAAVEELDHALAHYAQVILRDIGIDIMTLPMAGAAGGTGGGLVALLGAELEAGGDIICDALGLDSHLQGAELVLTGEGQLDNQTIYGKAPISISQRTQALGIPTIAIVGTLGKGYSSVFKYGITAIEIASPHAMPLHEAMDKAYPLIRDATERAVMKYAQQHP